MKIKIQKDIDKLLQYMKESETILTYETENSINTIQYNKIENQFNRTNKSKYMKLSSNGVENERMIFHLLWIDRKYVNPILVNWNI